MADVMEKFFAPKSVCVIGASSTSGKPGNVVVKNMRGAGYKGDVYLVNPRGGEIEGYKVHCVSFGNPHGVIFLKRRILKYILIQMNGA